MPGILRRRSSGNRARVFHPTAQACAAGTPVCLRSRQSPLNALPKPERMNITRIRGQFTIRDTDPLVNSHRVQDIHILPGVSMLDAVYKTLRSQRPDLALLALRNIIFHEPVVTNAQIDRKLTVTVDVRGNEGRVT